MGKIKRYLGLTIMVQILTTPSAFPLELKYDAEKNNFKVFGPFVKYNFVNRPYSLGLQPFAKNDLSLTIDAKSKKIEAHWPKYFPNYGDFNVYNSLNEKIVNFEIDSDSIRTTNKSHFYEVPIESEEVKSQFPNGIHFCVESKTEFSTVEICSDRMALNNNTWAPTIASNKVKVHIDEQMVPANAQVNIDNIDTEFNFLVQYESGLKIKVNEKIAEFGLDKVVVNTNAKTIGIISPQGVIQQSESGFINKIKRSLSEKNYYVDKLNNLKLSEKSIGSGVYEFANPSKDFSLQTFIGSVSRQLETAEGIQFAETEQLATYSSEVKISGTKAQGLKIKGEDNDSLSLKGNRFQWNFKTPIKGDFNYDVLSLKKEPGKGQFTHYTTKVFRGHSGSISLRALVASSLDFKVVSGSAIDVDYWPERVFSSSSFFSQRWGVSAGLSTTSADLKFDAFGENLIQTNSHITLMGRFTRGVRPIQSSFGLGARYFKPALTRSPTLDVNPQLFGVGLFWHSAPQLLVDQIVNLVPFFRYPKWMELAFYYYPTTLDSDFTVSTAFSFHARGRLMFARNWFFDATMNLHGLAFKKENFTGDVSYLEGSFGIGYNF